MSVKHTIVGLLAIVVLFSLHSATVNTFKLDAFKLPGALAAAQNDGTVGSIVGKLKDLLDKLRGDGIQASCKALPSMLDRVVPACLKCEDGTWKIKSGIGGIGLLKCRKSKKSEKEANGDGNGGNGAGRIGASLGGGALLALVTSTMLLRG